MTAVSPLAVDGEASLRAVSTSKRTACFRQYDRCNGPHVPGRHHDDLGPPTTRYVDVKPSAACLAAFLEAADLIDADDLAAYDDSYLRTATTCATVDEWLSALRRVPDATGFRPDAPLETLIFDLPIVFNILEGPTPVCDDARQERMVRRSTSF